MDRSFDRLSFGCHLERDRSPQLQRYARDRHALMTSAPLDAIAESARFFNAAPADVALWRDFAAGAECRALSDCSPVVLFASGDVTRASPKCFSAGVPLIIAKDVVDNSLSQSRGSLHD